MTATLWIAFAFLAALLIFLGITIYVPPKDNTGRVTLRFFTALSAGFSGGFFTGDALFKYHQVTGGGDIAISGAAGCALFFTIWLVYPKVPQLTDGFNIDVPAGWNFRYAVETIATTPCEYVGFRPEELDATTRAGKLSARTLQDVILQVRLIMATVDAVRPYEVLKEGSVYRLKVK
jgi:hypothetical protein